MIQYEVKQDEIARRKNLALHARQMLLDHLSVVAEDETSLMTCYRSFYVQICFSEMHPLLVLYFARDLGARKTPGSKALNALNLNSVLGSHSVNEEAGCYTFRATIWMDTELQSSRFFEIFDRCAEEASRGFHKLAGE